MSKATLFARIMERLVRFKRGLGLVFPSDITEPIAEGLGVSPRLDIPFDDDSTSVSRFTFDDDSTATLYSQRWTWEAT